MFVKTIISESGQMSIFLYRVFGSFKYIYRYRNIILNDMYDISINTLFVLLFGAFFIGMVASYQIALQMRYYLPMIYLSTLVTQSVLLELGPLLTGIAFAGRVSSSIAAEMTSMKISDQIDALRVMSINPIEYLVMPKIVSATLIIPFLTIMVEIMIILGAFLIAVAGLNIPANVFWEGTQKNFNLFYIFGGMIKSTFFGFFTVLMPSYFAFNAGFGSKEVGRVTTVSVIASVVAVIVLDYILTRMLFIW